MSEFIEILAIGSVLVGLTSLIYYEVLSVAWDMVPKIHMITPRFRIVFIVFALFAGHTICIWFYAVVYWILIHYFDYGTLVMLSDLQEFDGTFRTSLYFSSITYSSLGYGEIIPDGPLRILAGIQVINGLVLIGWSVSSTYLVMEKFWDMKKSKQRKRN